MTNLQFLTEKQALEFLTNMQKYVEQLNNQKFKNNNNKVAI